MEKQENYDKTAFEQFANLHPVEAFEAFPDRFMIYFKKMGYKQTKEQVEEMIKEIDND